MSRLTEVKFIEVDTIPKVLEAGVVYVSKRFQVAIHLCCCGCGIETVTPIKDGGWELNGSTITPSIGNQNFPCRSHYFIRDGKVLWV
jgi:hypothetical protein